MIIGSMENKRIAIITHEYPPHRGGAGVYCEELAYAAKQIGSNIEVWAPRDAKNSDSFKVHRMPQKGSQDWICSLRLAKYIKNNSPDVDYLHFADPGALKALLRLGYFLKNIPPFIITIHGSELLLFTRNPLEKYLFRLALKKAKKIHVLSNHNKNVLESLFPEISEKVIKIPGAPARRVLPGPDSGIGKIFQHSIKQEKLVLLCVGRIHPRKGQLELLQAVEKLSDISKQKICCKFVGPIIRQGYFNKIKKFADACGCEVVFTGDLLDQELQQAYREADFFALTSIPRVKSVEGFGFVYLEASAHGLPIIAHKTGGVEDAVRDGKTGFLVSPSNPNDLTEKIELLINDENVRNSLAENSVSWANQHTWENVAHALYAPLVGSK